MKHEICSNIKAKEKETTYAIDGIGGKIIKNKIKPFILTCGDYSHICQA